MIIDKLILLGKSRRFEVKVKNDEVNILEKTNKKLMPTGE